MAVAVREAPAPVLLNEGIAGSYRSISARRRALPGVSTVAEGAPAETTDGFTATPLLLAADGLHDGLTDECFGPLGVVVRYDGEAALSCLLAELPSSLTATVLRGAGETELPGAVADTLRPRAGRILFDAFPTGVAVSWAQTHGGPWPSTNTQHTSVGPTAIRRFLRPVTWQDAPAELLPPELAEGPAGLPRRIDGRLVLP